MWKCVRSRVISRTIRNYLYVDPSSKQLLALSSTRPVNHGRQVDRSTDVKKSRVEDNMPYTKPLATTRPVNPGIQIDRSTYYTYAKL